MLRSAVYRLLVVLHLLGATVWVGGHLVLSLVVLPRALRARDASVVAEFESGYERIGLPALLLVLWAIRREPVCPFPITEDILHRDLGIEVGGEEAFPFTGSVSGIPVDGRHPTGQRAHGEPSADLAFKPCCQVFWVGLDPR